jgi:signal transduction histidine kinase
MVTTTRTGLFEPQGQGEASPPSLPAQLRAPQIGVALIGLVAAAGVAYTTSRNPAAAPAQTAVLMRVLVIVALIAAGLYARTRRLHAQMGRVLIYAGLFAAVWGLNGSGNRVLFTLGAMSVAIAQTVFAYVALAHPVGRLRSRTERRVLWLTSAPMAVIWICALELTGQPAFKTPLVRCTPHCPRNPIALMHLSTLGGAVNVMAGVSLLAILVSTAILLLRRISSASARTRQSLFPVWATATINALLGAIYLLLTAADAPSAKTVGTLAVAMAVVLPLAVLIGLALERLFTGQALAEFVSELSRRPEADVEALMAQALRDPSLKIKYPRPGQGTYVDAGGGVVAEPDPERARTPIERDGRAVAAITYDPQLSDQERFVRAAGVAAVMRLDKAQLEADLRASNAELAASRMRLMESAQDERRRLERDLHDGVQQHLVALRIKLDLAAEDLDDHPEQARAVLAAVGREMDQVLAELRSLARGIYPSLLHDRGLAEALLAAARGTPTPALFSARGLQRYPEDTEVAVYYCCVEALQNVAKHAGSGAQARLTLRDDGARVHFEVCDTGAGFDPGAAPLGAGLVNMRDRIETVGGTLHIVSRPGAGTAIRGSVPID